MEFDWDPRKPASNLLRHGVSLVKATQVFEDPFALAEFDGEHSNDEDRFRMIGVSRRHRTLFVVVAERSDVPRIISARRATQAERSRYEAQFRG
mgnify:FL=1